MNTIYFVLLRGYKQVKKGLELLLELGMILGAVAWCCVEMKTKIWM